MLMLLSPSLLVANTYPSQVYFNGMLWQKDHYKPLNRGFSHYPYGWCYAYGDDVLEHCHDGIPIKKEAGPDQGTVLHLQGKHQTGGWRAALTLPAWVTGDFQRLLPSATLQIQARSTQGKTCIQVGMSDRSFKRLQPLKLEVLWPESLCLTSKWQRFSIDLADFQRLNPNFDAANSFTVFVQNSQSKAANFDIEISTVQIISTAKENHPNIRINQYAYTRHAEKYAVIQAGMADTAQLIQQDRLTVVLEKALSPARYEAASQEWLQRFDFSNVQQVGTFFIQVGKQKSSLFQIQDRPMQQLAKDSLHFFYLQRAGVNIDQGLWQHQAAHLEKARLLSDPTQKIDVRGGWYDAGDFGRYATTTALSTGVLLLLAEMGKHQAALDEARIGLTWLLKMQAADGGVYHKVASESGNTQHESTGPEENTHPLYIIDRMLGTEGSAKTTSDTALAAAVWATAARLWHKKDRRFAKQCHQAARKAWGYLEQHPKMYPEHGFYDPPNSHGGPYGPDRSDHDERLWAAASLWHLTGDRLYQQAMLQHFSYVHLGIPQDKRHPWAEVDNFAVYATLLAEAYHKEPISPYHSTVLTYQQNLLQRLQTSPHAWPLAKKDVVWGSNSLVAYLALDLLMTDRFLGHQQGSKGARQIMAYLLGINPMGLSYISGYGQYAVKNFFHSWFHHDGLHAVPAGFLAGGPNAEEGHWLSASALRCYRDEKSDWFSNEVAINWNAALVFVSSMLDQTDESTAKKMDPPQTN